MSLPAVTIFACLVTLLGLVTLSRSEEKEVDLEGFEGITSCLPLNVLVTTTEDGSKLKVDAEEGIVNAIQAEVVDGILVLSLSDGIATEAPAKITLAASKEGFKSVKNTGSGRIVLAPGTKADSMELSNDGKGELIAVDLEVTELAATNTGNSALFASGAIGNVTATVERGSVFLAGPTGTVTVSAPNMFSSPEFVILAGSDEASIVGEGTGTTKLLYDVGSCDVQATIAFGRDLCTQVATEELVQRKDDVLASLLWTCNTEAEADPGCKGPVDQGTAGGATSSTSTATGSGASATSATASSSGDAEATAMAEGEDAQATAEADDANEENGEPECSVDDEELKMLES